MATFAKGLPPLSESDLSMKKGLSAAEVDRRLVSLAKTHRRLESALCFYLQEVEERQLYCEYGHASTVDYARERLGFEDRKTWSLLQIARRFKVLPELKKAFSQGAIPWTKAREAVKAATPETDRSWVEKCLTMSNRRIENEVRQTLPPVKKKTLVLVLEDEMLDVWDQTREACERLAGKTLTDLEVFDLMCAEVLCTYAATPPFDPEKEDEGGFVRSIAERDGWKCVRPGCRSRTALQGDHIVPRSQGGSDSDDNKIILCAACHHAKTTGILKVSGRAPDQLSWKGPFGVIEEPLPLAEPTQGVEKLLVRETKVSYGTGAPPTDTGDLMGLHARSRTLQQGRPGTGSDHVVTGVATTYRTKKAPVFIMKPFGALGNAPSSHVSEAPRYLPERAGAGMSSGCLGSAVKTDALSPVP